MIKKSLKIKQSIRFTPAAQQRVAHEDRCSRPRPHAPFPGPRMQVRTRARSEPDRLLYFQTFLEPFTPAPI